jgi:Uma2 family endonuclease
MEAIEQVPKTALDVFRMLPEGTLCEVIDNVLYMSPAPKYTHQRLLGLFFRKIANHVEERKMGEAFISPVDVYFNDLLSVVQPDLIYVSNENRTIMNEDGYFYGAPDLIIEVLSKDKKRDTVTKKNLYERAGVKEYIIANPENTKTISYTLTSNGYQVAFEGEGVFKSSVLEFELRF